MATATPLTGAARDRRSPARRRARPWSLLALSCLVAAVLLALPLVFLLLEAHGAGAADGRPPDLPPADRHPAVEHRPADRGGDASCARSSAPLAAWCVERTDLPGRRIWAVLVVVPLRHPRLRGQLRLGVALHLGAGLPGRGARDDPGRLPAGLPAGRGQPAQRRPGPGGGGPQPRARAGPAPSSGSPSARPGAPSSAAACWSRWSCWPSTARSRSSATRPSPPRSSPSSRSPSTSPPPARCRWCSSLLSLLVLAGEGAARAAGAGSAGPARWPSATMPATAPGPGDAAGARPVRRAGRCSRWACRSGPAVYWMLDGVPPALPAGRRLHAQRRLAHRRSTAAAPAALATVMALPVALLAVRHRGRMRHAPRAQHLPGPGACRAWSSRSPCPTSPSATRTASATRARRS